MTLKYNEQIAEDKYYKRFLEDTKEMWSQREQPRVRDFIKWAIIKGELKDSPRVLREEDANAIVEWNEEE